MKIFLWLILTPIILIVLGVIGTELHKGYWDSRVRAMCAEEGGMTVFEMVQLSKEEYIKYGGIGGVIYIPNRTSSRADDYPYILEREQVEIKKGSLEVWKRETRFYRKSDNLELGRYISFSRIGGDFPTFIAIESSYSCRDLVNFDTDSSKKIFIIEGEK